MADNPAWIHMVAEDEAEGELKAAFDTVADKQSGRVAHVFRIHSLNPRSMLQHQQYYRTLLFGSSPLRRYQREMIAVVVSALNRCHY